MSNDVETCICIGGPLAGKARKEQGPELIHMHSKSRYLYHTTALGGVYIHESLTIEQGVRAIVERIQASTTNRGDHMSKHTPGPWKALTYPCQSESIAIESVYCELGKLHVFDDWEECKANARLIEEAPDMLFALKALITCHGTSNMKAALDNAKDITKRIEGEEVTI